MDARDQRGLTVHLMNPTALKRTILGGLAAICFAAVASANPAFAGRWRLDPAQSSPLDGWTTTTDGRPLPTTASAVWHLPEGDFTYVRGAFDPALVEFDRAPSSTV